jgi:PadR family transcriptional regulator PadR
MLLEHKSINKYLALHSTICYDIVMADAQARKETYNVENTQSQMRKGFLEFPVLLIIGAKPTYVPDILKQLQAANLLVVEGTLYPLLSRVKRYELVEYQWQESKSGPPRKMYTITALGKEVLMQLETSWKTLDSSVNTLIKHYEKNN